MTTRDSSPHILVVDDDDGVRTVACRMLEIRGFAVSSADNGVTCMQAVREDPSIDLVLLDLLMPTQEGMETIQELRRDHPAVKIIAMSGGGTNLPQQYLSLAASLGADATLAKPFVGNGLVAVIEGVLGATNSEGSAGSASALPIR